MTPQSSAGNYPPFAEAGLDVQGNSAGGIDDRDETRFAVVMTPQSPAGNFPFAEGGPAFLEKEAGECWSGSDIKRKGDSKKKPGPRNATPKAVDPTDCRPHYSIHCGTIF